VFVHIPLFLSRVELYSLLVISCTICIGALHRARFEGNDGGGLDARVGECLAVFSLYDFGILVPNCVVLLYMMLFLGATEESSSSDKSIISSQHDFNEGEIEMQSLSLRDNMLLHDESDQSSATTRMPLSRAASVQLLHGHLLQTSEAMKAAVANTDLDPMVASRAASLMEDISALLEGTSHRGEGEHENDGSSNDGSRHDKLRKQMNREDDNERITAGSSSPEESRATGAGVHDLTDEGSGSEAGRGNGRRTSLAVIKDLQTGLDISSGLASIRSLPPAPSTDATEAQDWLLPAVKDS
jgi:hypothetical protein